MAFDTPILIGNPEIHNFEISEKSHSFAIVGKGNYEIEPILKNTKTIISEFENASKYSIKTSQLPRGLESVPL